MIRKKLFQNAFILVVVVTFLNKIALTLRLYWSLHYFDTLVHFLAGIAVGLGSVWLYLNKKETLPTSQIFFSSLIGSIVVGVVWEIFEVVNGITFFSDGIHYVTDTGSDLLMDTLGGLIAAFYTKNLFQNNNYYGK